MYMKFWNYINEDDFLRKNVIGIHIEAEDNIN